MKTFKNIILVLSTGYIFFLYSELLFWARVRPGDSFGEWAITWLAYSLMAFVFLLIVSYFRVKNIWALFLAGAVFGWLGEGVIVQTTYEMLPLSISFTALAWHALITVWIGWYAVHKSLHSTHPFSTLKLCVVIGLCYGMWAIMWWLEPDGGVSSILEFGMFSFIATILSIPAYWLADWSSSENFRPTRWINIFILSLFVLIFFLVVVPTNTLALIILPILLGLAYLGLRWNRINEENGSLLNKFNQPVSVWKYFSLLAIPFVSAPFYALATFLNLQWHTNWILYLITTPLGFILFAISLVKLWRMRKTITS